MEGVDGRYQLGNSLPIWASVLRIGVWVIKWIEEFKETKGLVKGEDRLAL